MATADELRASIRSRGFELDTAAVQLDMLNQSLRRLAGSHTWAWLLTRADEPLVAGTQTYDAPADTLRLLSLTGTVGDRPVEYMSTDYLELARLAAIGARPPAARGVWAETGAGKYDVWPYDVAGTLHLGYVRAPAALAAGTDVPDMPVPYHDVLVLDVCAQLAGRERQWDASRVFTEERDLRLREMSAQLGLGRHQHAVAVSREFGPARRNRGRHSLRGY